MMMSAMAGLISGRRAAYDANTLLMCHFDGANGSTTITDAVGRHTLTAVGDAQISTAQAKFGQSLLMAGDGNYVSVPPSADFALGTADFTIEQFVRFAAVNRINGTFRIGSDAGPDNGLLSICPGMTAIGAHNAGRITISQYYSGAWDNKEFNWSPSANTWYHLALVRASGTITLYIDGSSIGNYAGSHTIGGSGLICEIGRVSASAGYGYNGNLDELRISNVARDHAGFPPTAPYK